MKKILCQGLLLALILTPGLSFAAGDIYLDDGTPVTYNDPTVPWSNTHDEAYTSQKKAALFDVTGDSCIATTTGTSGDLTSIGLITTSSGDYSLVGVYDGDTTGCWACGSYTACVTATFYDEYVFVVASSSGSSTSPSSTVSDIETSVLELLYAILVGAIFFGAIAGGYALTK